MTSLKKIYYQGKSTIRLFRKEHKVKFSVPLEKKMLCYTHGFLSENSIIYNLSLQNHNLYVSDIQRFNKCSMIDLNYSFILDNKYIFEKFFSTECNLIKSDFVIIDGLIIPTSYRFEIKCMDDIIPILNSEHTLIIKPITGGGGFNIHKIEFNAGKYLIDNVSIDIKSLTRQLQKLNHYLVSEEFHQKGFSNTIFPASLNTIRILTMYDSNAQESFIAAAVHRFGTMMSGFVDNWSNGGICAKVDIESGILSKAVSYPQKGKLIWHETHPDTGKKIEGQVVPNWEKVKKTVLKLANKHFYLPYVGWDVVLSDNETYILEANSNSDVNLLQVHTPLLSDIRVREFYKYHKVI